MTSMRMASGFSAAAVLEALGAGACGEDGPACGGFQGERGDLADVIFVVDNHETRFMARFSHAMDDALFLMLCDCRMGPAGPATAEALDHVEDELFDLAGLDLGLGEELGGAELELLHFKLGDLAAGVDDEGQGAEGGLLAEPIDEGEAVSVGKGEVEDEEVRRGVDGSGHGLFAGGGVIDADLARP